MGYTTVGLFVLALFASANAFFPLVPEGKELIYHYHGIVAAGTHMPLGYASVFDLHGLLHVQTDKNSTFVRFSDLKYKLQNGKFDFWHEVDAKEIDVPKELEVFEHPFKVVYEPCGHALGIVVDAEEPQYAVNIKRGIASMLQMYTEKLEWDKKHPYAFHAKEHTLYGKGPAYYTVYTGEDDWTVKKMYEPHSNHHMYAHLSTNTQMSTCDVKYDEPLTRDSFHTYHIVKKDGSHIVDTMESNGGLYYTPFAGEGYSFFVYMNQTMTLEKIVAPTPMAFKNDKFYHGLTYYTADFNTMEKIADIFNGRRKYDYSKMLVELEEMLYDTVKYIHEYHLDLTKPDWARGQLINRMLVLMFQLDQQQLDTMVQKLMQKTGEVDKEALHVYYHMLPLIGTHASYMYMMKLMKTKKVKDKLALEWLENMPFNVKEPNKMLIDHMSEMLNWGDEISMDVRKAAIVCFGTFLEKALFRYNKLNHINNWTGHEGHENVDNFTPDYDLDEVFPGPKYYEKYITMLGEKMKVEKTIGLRSAYISALYNSHMKKALHYLWPVAKGELWEDNYLQLLAITSMGSSIGRNEELSYEVFWPIMSDHKLATNLRVAAFDRLMQTHPSIQRLINLFWQMEYEPNFMFYQYYYSYLEHISQTTDPCFDDFRTSVKQIMRYIEKPEKHGLTGFYDMDYMDTKYEYGHQFKGWLVSSPWEHQKTLKLKMDFTMDSAKFPMYGFLIRTSGMEASIFDDVMIYAKDPTKMFNFEKVMKAYNDIYNNKDIRIDIGVTKYGQVVKNCHYDATNIKEITQFLEYLMGDKFNYVKKYFSIAYPQQTTLVLPTDMGFPAVFKVYIPTVYFFDFKITKEVVNKMITYQYDTHVKEWAHGHVGLSFYNPFIDMYQGVTRMITYDWVQPLYFDLSINPTQQTVKFSWKRHDDPQKDMFGFKTNAATVTYFRDDWRKNLLKQSSPQSENWEIVSFGEEHQDDRVLYEHDDSNTGYHQIVTKYDSDAWSSNMTIFKYYNFLHYAQNYHTWFGHWFLTKFHALMHAVAQPYPYANGILVRSEVSKKFPVTNVDINVRLTNDFKRGEMWLFPGAKHNLRATYSVKNNDVTTKSWDANLIWDTDMGHHGHTLKAILSRIIPGQKEFRVCIDHSRKYTEEGVDGLSTIAMSHSTEPKCTKDEKVMEIKVKGEKLQEQKDHTHLYGECYEQMWSDIHHANSLDCYYARDSLRKWTYDVQTYNMPTEYKGYINRFFDFIKMNYIKYFTMYEQATTEMDKDKFQIVQEYPMIGDKVDLHVYTYDHDYKFGGIPMEQFPYYKLNMFATKHFSPLFRFMHTMGWTKICDIHPGTIGVHGKYEHYEMPKEWTMLYGEAATDAKHGLWVKSMGEHKTAMKMMHGEHKLEIIPTGHHTYDVMVDGEKMPKDTYQLDKQWVFIDLIKDTGVFSVVCMHTGNHIIFDGHHMQVESPNTDNTMFGKCVGK